MLIWETQVTEMNRSQVKPKVVCLTYHYSLRLNWLLGRVLQVTLYSYLNTRDSIQMIYNGWRYNVIRQLSACSGFFFVFFCHYVIAIYFSNTFCWVPDFFVLTVVHETRGVFIFHMSSSICFPELSSKSQ